MCSSWHKKKFFWLLPVLTGGNENCMLNAKISALAGGGAPLTLLALLLSACKADRHQREHKVLPHHLAVILPQREWANNFITRWNVLVHGVRCITVQVEGHWAGHRTVGKETGCSSGQKRIRSVWPTSDNPGMLELSRFAGQNGVCLAYGNRWSKWCQTGNFSLLTEAFLSPQGAVAGKGMLDEAARPRGQRGAAERAGDELWHRRSHKQAARCQSFWALHRAGPSHSKRSRARLHKQELAPLPVSLA